MVVNTIAGLPQLGDLSKDSCPYTTGTLLPYPDKLVQMIPRSIESAVALWRSNKFHYEVKIRRGDEVYSVAGPPCITTIDIKHNRLDLLATFMKWLVGRVDTDNRDSTIIFKSFALEILAMHSEVNRLVSVYAHQGPDQARTWKSTVYWEGPPPKHNNLSMLLNNAVFSSVDFFKTKKQADNVAYLKCTEHIIGANVRYDVDAPLVDVKGRPPHAWGSLYHFLKDRISKFPGATTIELVAAVSSSREVDFASFDYINMCLVENFLAKDVGGVTHWHPVSGV